MSCLLCCFVEMRL